MTNFTLYLLQQIDFNHLPQFCYYWWKSGTHWEVAVLPSLEDDFVLVVLVTFDKLSAPDDNIKTSLSVTEDISNGNFRYSIIPGKVSSIIPIGLSRKVSRKLYFPGKVSSIILIGQSIHSDESLPINTTSPTQILTYTPEKKYKLSISLSHCGHLGVSGTD